MTLPTRQDGGIDWDRIIFPTEKDISYGWIIGGHKIHRVSAFEFNQMAIAHTRERCAMKALEQRCERGIPWDKACVAIAAEIRKMED